MAQDAMPSSGHQVLGTECRVGNKTHHPKLFSYCSPGAQVTLCFWIEENYIRRTSQSVANGLASLRSTN